MSADSHTTLILVTHAQTQWNAEGKTQCHIDTPLNKTGFKMAELLSDRLAQEPIAAIYASDLQRAYDTTGPLAARLDLPVFKEMRLREGRWHNHTDGRYPTLPFHVEHENRADVRQRMIEVMTEIARKNQGGTILVVSHGGAVQEFINYVLDESGNETLRYRGVQTALNVLRFENEKWTCLSLNNDNHLTKK